jgi:hypothetical protein
MLTEQDFKTAPAPVSIWRSCCFLVDARSALFFSQLFISVFVLFFCAFQLITNRACEMQALYSGIVSGMVGYWLPNPKLH